MHRPTLGVQKINELTSLDHFGLSFSSFGQIFAELFSLLSSPCPANELNSLGKIQNNLKTSKL